mmetsp:Transcript_17494/g.44515  ORF Transcript_17494/g.44515 Transcript_17494/m.44515 type:complete len:363 (+) Transcript_17494:1258-2346(+)
MVTWTPNRWRLSLTKLAHQNDLMRLPLSLLGRQLLLQTAPRLALRMTSRRLPLQIRRTATKCLRPRIWHDACRSSAIDNSSRICGLVTVWPLAAGCRRLFRSPDCFALPGQLHQISMFLKSIEDASGWKGDNLGAAAAVFVVLIAAGFPTMSFLDMVCSVHIRFWLGFTVPAIGTLIAPAAASWIFLCYPALSKRSRLTTVLGSVAAPTLVHLVLAYGVRHHAMMLAQDLLVPDCAVGPKMQLQNDWNDAQKILSACGESTVDVCDQYVQASLDHPTWSYLSELESTGICASFCTPMQTPLWAPGGPRAVACSEVVAAVFIMLQRTCSQSIGLCLLVLVMTASVQFAPPFYESWRVRNLRRS